MTGLRLLFALVLLSVSGVSLAAATFVPVYLDGASEGFNSNGAPHAASTTAGNPGTTLGEQRKWAFEKALEFWARRLDSGVIIQVEAEMDDLTCNSNSAVLGAAGANTIHANWSGAAGGSNPPFTNTWYSQALANRIANKDNGLATADIGSVFNKKIDESSSCLGSFVWYYGMGDAPGNTVSFFKTALHEIGHGINVQTFVNLATGAKNSGLDDIYMRNLHDHTTGRSWPIMTNAERALSAVDSNDLHWIGTQVINNSGILASGRNGSHVQLYAPLPLEQGSSVSHWDTDVDDASGNSELMEPSATGSEKLLVTDEMLHDMGWNDVPANNCTFASDTLTVSGTKNGTVSNNACVRLVYDGATIDSGATTGTAGLQIELKSGFNVQSGATFAANVDPDIGL